MANATISLRGALLLQAENLCRAGALLLPSRLSAADLPRLLKLCSGRAVTLLMETENAHSPETLSAMSAAGLPVIRRATPDFPQAVAAAVGEGRLVLCVPPSVTAPAGAAYEIPRATLEDVCRCGVPVQPVGIDHPAAASLAVSGTDDLPEAILCVGPVIPAENVAVPTLIQGLLEAAEQAFSARPSLNVHLGRLLLEGFKRNGGVNAIVDGLDGSRTGYDRVFAAAAALAGVIRKSTKQPRVGIVLPPGRAGLIANIAAVLAGKTPVNLNFTAGKEAVESAIKQAEIDRFLTADSFVRKMQTFPWPPIKNLIFLERTLPFLKGKMFRWLMALKLLPVPLLAKLLKVPARGGDSEAVLLFTSGSSGEPKGVALTHRNVVANVTQFGSRLGFGPEDNILGSLPLFHSFGSTVTVWFPVISGHGLVTYPNPADAPKLAELIEQHKATLVVSTPTFLRGFLRRVKVEQLAGVKLVVTGAEKLPANLEEEFRKKFGKPVLEGYGLTETSPVTNFNLPEPDNPAWPALPSRRVGSVGTFLSGVAARITDPITGDPLPLSQAGILWLRGPNVFNGYLKQPRLSEEVLRDGWFRTSDIARVDEDGFLIIEGRLSRFSKIGGEMVPHETVEDHITRALGLDTDSERRIAVVGIPDEEKGEALVLISTVASEAVKQELIQLRYTLLERGIPSLWIPKRLVRVEQIPVLASGKMDIRACEKLALTRSVS